MGTLLIHGLIALVTAGALMATTSPKEGYLNWVKRQFEPHSVYPRGYLPDYRIDGESQINMKQAGNPETRNPMRELFTYPNEDARYLIKADTNWTELVGGPNLKQRQIDRISTVLGKWNHPLLDPEYKQYWGQPKFPLKQKVYFAA